MKSGNIFKDFFIIISLLILFFILFIGMANIIKIINYLNQIDKVVKSTSDSNTINIQRINSQFNNIEMFDNNKYNPNQQYKANQLGFVNHLYDLDGTEWGEGINILFISSDKDSLKNIKARADVIIVFRINNNGKILSISIPRDTLIKVVDENKKWDGQSDKIGHSFYWGGMDNLILSVEKLLDSPIYKVALVDNFKKFEAFLSIIGGLKIDKELEGKLGIQWIRNRNFKDGDIERCKRHQVFLKRAFIKMWKMSKNGNCFYSKILYDVFKNIIYTDLTENDFLNIIYILRKNNFNPQNDFLTGVLPGQFSKYNSVVLQRNNLDCWILDNDIINKIQFLFYSRNDSYKSILKNKIDIIDFIKLDYQSCIHVITKKLDDIFR